MSKQKRSKTKTVQRGGELIDNKSDSKKTAQKAEITPNDDVEIISRTALKNELKAQQQQLVEWTQLPDSQLDALPLPADVREAIVQARGMKADSGRRRLLRWAAKQLDDDEFAAINAKLEDLTHRSSRATAIEHECEQWRSRLLASDATASTALTDLLNLHPQIDRQSLRQTIRSANREKLENKPPKHQRELFRMLRAALTEE